MYIFSNLLKPNLKPVILDDKWVKQSLGNHCGPNFNLNAQSIKSVYRFNAFSHFAKGSGLAGCPTVWMWIEAEAHPDDIDPDKDVDWIVVWDVLKHAHAWVEAWLSAEVFGEWHFVHAEWPLGKNKMVVRTMAWRDWRGWFLYVKWPVGWFSLKQPIYNYICNIKNK